MSIIEIIEEKEIWNRTDFRVGYILGQLDAIMIMWDVHGKNKNLARACLDYMIELHKLDRELYSEVKTKFIDVFKEMREMIKSN